MPQFYYHSELSPKLYRRSLWYKINNWRTVRPSRSSFDYDSILKMSVAWSKVDMSKIREVPDAAWWKKLCGAIAVKNPQHSNYGSKLLQDKLVRTLGGRLLFEQLWENNRAEIERFDVHLPIFVVGLPRCNASMAAHMNARSGLFMSMRTRDSMFPAIPSELERHRMSQDVIGSAHRIHPQMRAVFPIRSDLPDTDIGLQLMNPRALAWGMLHGLNEYLYECLQEDQEHVYDFESRVMRVFQWYRQCGEFSDSVTREINEVVTPRDMIRHGRRMKLVRMPWLVHSPFALLHIKSLHKVFPDMRLIWCHRALSQCVASMCAAIAIHTCVYTGQSPTTATMSQIGEQVCGIFGSGSEHAVDYLATFPKERMVHWHNRDIARSGVRLVNKTLDAFNIETDRFRTHQTVDGNVEFVSLFRPKLDSELGYFGLHEGVVGEHFQAYIRQFEQYAYEARFGIKMQDYVMIGSDYAKQRFAFGDVPKKDRVSSFSMLQSPGNMGIGDGGNATNGGSFASVTPHE